MKTYPQATNIRVKFAGQVVTLKDATDRQRTRAGVVIWIQQIPAGEIRPMARSLPKIFSKVHKRYKTPFMALIIQGITAFFLSMYAGISQLISFSVFNMAIMYLLVCLSLIVLKKEETKFIGQEVLPFVGIAISGFLIYSTTIYDKIFGTVFVILGIGVYFFFSRKNGTNSKA